MLKCVVAGVGGVPTALEHCLVCHSTPRKRSVQYAHPFMHSNIQVAKPFVCPIFIILQGNLGLCNLNGIMPICICICTAVIHFVQNSGFFIELLYVSIPSHK